MYADTVDIFDDDFLFRKIPKGAVVNNEENGQPRITRLAIQNGTVNGDKTNDMSVAIEKLESLDKIKMRFDGFSIGKIQVSDCRGSDQQVEHVPELDFYSHGHVSGKKTGGVRKKLSLKMELVHHCDPFESD